MLKNSIDEVSRLQQDASKAVEDLATGKTENVTGVMTAMEKSDLAFKTLLAIRAKLMEAYEEIKNIPCKRSSSIEMQDSGGADVRRNRSV